MKVCTAPKHKVRKALVLVAVLWMVVLATVIVAAIGQDSRLDMRLCLAGGEQVRGRWALRAGVEKAIAVLNDDTKRADSLTDLWSDNEDDLIGIELEQCQFDVEVIDEASKLNVNTASKSELLELDNMTDEIADAIIDWRDKDDNPANSGVESGYYLNLPYGYKIRNGPFQTTRELLLVKGVSAELLYGEDTNLNGKLDYNEKDGEANWPPDNGDDVLNQGWIAYLTCYSYDNNKDALGDDRININKADEKELVKSLNISKSYAKWIVENRKKNQYKSIADLINKNSPKKAKKKRGKDSESAEPLDLQTFCKIADKITVNKEKKIPGRVNINTASRVVLAALLGGNEKLADSITAYREGLIGGMESIADVMDADSVNIDTFKKIANYITTRCSVFTIRCVAGSDKTGAMYQAEAVVDRAQRPVAILYRYQGANN